MISLVIILILAWSFYIGYSRGLILQLFYGAGSIVSLMVATAKYKELTQFLYLWLPFSNATQGSSTYYFDEQYLFDLDKVFYAGLAFLLIYMMVYSLVRFLGLFVHVLDGFNPDAQWGNLVSGGVSVMVTFLSLEIVLTLLSTIPLAAVQDRLHASWVANGMLQYAPLINSFLRELWLSNSIG